MISGYEVAVAISKVKTAKVNRPEQDVKLNKVTITDKAPVIKRGKK